MKKSMLTLFALSALTSSNMYSLDTQSVATTLIQQNLTNDTNQKPSTSTRTSDSSNQATNDSKKSKDSSEKTKNYSSNDKNINRNSSNESNSDSDLHDSQRWENKPQNQSSWSPKNSDSDLHDSQRWENKPQNQSSWSPKNSDSDSSQNYSDKNKMPNIGLRAVQDQNGNFIGGYQVLGNIQGYAYGSFYQSNANQTSVSVIQSSANGGTPVSLEVPGASSTVIGYLDNPAYKAGSTSIAGGSSSLITLYQYNAPSADRSNQVSTSSTPTQATGTATTVGSTPMQNSSGN